ncbi:hypothetical protein HYDPIDRAFT_107247 [Hydnomerulius pinastri MD-312]|nr:hypothetical protein HYDPIDRAFT_107247 [Hydnomerulius pinastri MD-312]
MIQHRPAIEKELSGLMSMIWATERSLDAMRREASKLQGILRDSETLGISRLPVEIMSLIFKEAASSLDSSSEQPTTLFGDETPEWPKTRPELLLSHVSRYWRAVAVGTPSLWTSIRLYVKQSVDLLDLYFARARGMPLDLAFRQHFICGIHPRQTCNTEYPRITDTILNHMHVCRRLEVRTNVFIPELLEGLGRTPAPLLQEIVLHHPRSNTWEPTFSSSSFPRLAHLDLGELITISTTISTKALASLTLSGIPAFGLPAETFRGLLSGLRSLSHLALLDEAVDFDRARTMDFVEMPSLRSLLLKPGPDVSRLYLTGLMETLVTPALQELTLDFSNVASPREIQLFLRHLKREAPRFLSVRHITVNSPFEGFDIANALVHAAPNVESLSLSRYSVDSILAFLTHDARREAFPKLRRLYFENPHLDWDVLLSFVRKRRDWGKSLDRLGFRGFQGSKDAALNEPFKKLLDACLVV